MLMSRKHKFIFIHVYKNAGTSITNALMPFAVTDWQRRARRYFRKINIDWYNPQPLHDHVTAPEIAGALGKDVFKSFFSFAVVRNPWDWQVSLYQYMLKNTAHRQHELVKSFKSFNEYIKWRCTQDIWLQKDFVYSEEGDLLVDYVGRFERLEEDFQAVCSKLGINATLPKMNVSNTKPYQAYYDDEPRELVRETFEPDIRLFGYQF